MSETLLEAVRALRVADPDLGLKPLLAKLREQQPDLGAATREVREALIVITMGVITLIVITFGRDYFLRQPAHVL